MMIKITENQTSTVVNILVRGFLEDPSFCYVFPHPEKRLQALTALFPMFVTDGVQRGEVLMTPEEQGAIIWYPPETEIDEAEFAQTWEKVKSITAEFGGLEAVQKIEEIAGKAKLAEIQQPHCEIRWLAILPEARGQGMGANLLLPVLNYADTKKVGCYLVSSNPRNLTFYQRYGFQQRLCVNIDELSFTTMWRNPVAI